MEKFDIEIICDSICKDLDYEINHRIESRKFSILRKKYKGISKEEYKNEKLKYKKYKEIGRMLQSNIHDILDEIKNETQ